MTPEQLAEGSSEGILPIRFCSSCGAKLETDTPVCPLCGTNNSALLSEAPRSRLENTSSRIPNPENLLLERLQSEPKARPQVPLPILWTIMIAVFAIGAMIYLATKKDDLYLKSAATPLASSQDSTEIFEKRLVVQPKIDSLLRIVQSAPQDSKAHLALANQYYDASYWKEACTHYDLYLRDNPRDADARVDYAFALAEGYGNIQAALTQIEHALEYHPDHVNALFNGGILSLRLIGDGGNHSSAVSQARNYFERARAAATSKAPEMVPQIDKVLEEMDKVASRTATTTPD